MNLMKLFNFNYFKENIKKSKGLIAFFFGVVIIINIIVLLAIINSSNIGDYTEYINFEGLSIATFVGAYAIPLVFSMALLGFVFKQKSVDFVMSKPISRKSIYFTNVVGGIIVILLFILLNALIFGLFSLMFSSIAIPFAILVDYFIFLSMTYIFTFSICVLAISIAGNFMSSMVIVLLVLFLFPFSVLLNRYYEGSRTFVNCDKIGCKTNYKCNYGDAVCSEYQEKGYYPTRLNKDFSYKITSPAALFIDTESSLSYSSYRLAKMFILSVIYLLIGSYAFKNRKMENNETSFKSEFVHYLVKSLTMIPVAFVAYMLVKDVTLFGIIVAIFLTLIYYALYDLVTRKEIYKFLKSSFIALITLCIMVFVYYLYDVSNSNKNILVDNIDKIVVDLDDEEIVITNKNVIGSVVKNKINTGNGDGAYYQAYFYSNGERYKDYISLNNLVESSGSNVFNEGLQKNLQDFDLKKITYIKYKEMNIPLTKELSKLLEKAERTLGGTNNSLELYRYKNHKYQKVSLDLMTNKDLADYIVNYTNNKIIDLIANNSSYVYFSGYYSESSRFDSLNFYEEDNIFNYVLGNNLNKFRDYLKNDNNVLTDKNLVIYMYIEGRRYNITINDLVKFIEVYNSYKEAVKDNPEYQELLNYNKTIDMDGKDEY